MALSNSFPLSGSQCVNLLVSPEACDLYHPAPKLLHIPNPALNYLESLRFTSLAPPSSSFSFNSWLNSFPSKGFCRGSRSFHILPETALPSMRAAPLLVTPAASLHLCLLLLLSFWLDPGVVAKELKFATLVSGVLSLLFLFKLWPPGSENQVPGFILPSCCLGKTKLREWVIKLYQFLVLKL